MVTVHGQGGTRFIRDDVSHRFASPAFTYWQARLPLLIGRLVMTSFAQTNQYEYRH